MKIYSSPLQGYTEAPWRNEHSKMFGSIDAYLTPFIRAEKSSCESTEGKEERILTVRNKDIRDISPENNSVEMLVPQVLASGPDEFCFLTDMLVEKGYKWIDINFGCPFPMITKRHKGCGILPFPDEVKEIMMQCEKYKGIEFSVKMRLGAQDCDEWKEVLPILNDTELRMITLHPRTGKQQYKGDVDMVSFANFMNECRHPLVYNGDINSIDDINRIQQDYSSLHGIMIGRGLLGRPSLAYEFKNSTTMPQQELYDKIVRMHDVIYDYYEKRLQGSSQLLNKMKCYWEYLSPSIDKKRYKEIKKSVSIEKYIQAVRKY